jgi:hypothetical protein
LSRNNVPSPSKHSKLVKQAEKAVAEYSHVMNGAFTEAEPLLWRALEATYTAALDVMKHPDLMEMFLADRRSGPVSRNPFKPIVRRLWHDSHTRHSLHRHAGAMAWAESKNIAPKDFIEEVKAKTIKKAAAEYARKTTSADERKKADIEQRSTASNALDNLTPISLPEEIAAGLDIGCDLAVVRKRPDGSASLFLLKVNPIKVDALIIRETRR